MRVSVPGRTVRLEQADLDRIEKESVLEARPMVVALMTEVATPEPIRGRSLPRFRGCPDGLGDPSTPG
jgi:hypothetical protein